MPLQHLNEQVAQGGVLAGTGCRNETVHQDAVWLYHGNLLLWEGESPLWKSGGVNGGILCRNRSQLTMAMRSLLVEGHG